MMFKYKIKIILKSGGVIRLKAENEFVLNGLIHLQLVDCIIVKHWYQRWK